MRCNFPLIIQQLYFYYDFKEYTVIHWVRGQQQFCLTQGRICCPKTHQTKLLLSPKIFLFTLSTRISIS